MNTVVVGVRTATRNAGICVLFDGDVVEAVTIEGPRAVPKARVDPQTGKAMTGSPVGFVNTDILTTLAADTIAMGQDILAGLPNSPTRALWVVEGLVPDRRASVARGRVLEAVIAQAVNQGAIVALLRAAGENVLVVPSAGFDRSDPALLPAPLRGPKPDGWRGRKGSDRGQQQAAYRIALAGLTERGATIPTTPTDALTAAEYVARLRATVRDLTPTSGASVSDVLRAATVALAGLPRPSEVPDLTPLQVAVDATTRAGVAPHLNNPVGLTDLQKEAAQ